MTRLPTDTALTHLFDSVRNLVARTRPGAPRRIDEFETRLRTAVQRDRSGCALPDGYPTSTGGSSTGVSAESSTERAALALAEGVTARDRHHDLTARAIHALEGIVLNANVLAAALASIDDLTGNPEPEPKTCDHCSDHRGAKGNNLPIHVTGTVGDRLERVIALCEPCYHFVEQTAAAGSRTGYLPTPKQIRHHEERGRWRIRVA